MLGSGRILRSIALGAAVSVKQYGIFLLPSFWFSGRLKFGDVVLGGLLAALVMVPFAWWDFDLFWYGIMKYHLMLPFRGDSLSVPSLIFHKTAQHYQISAAWGLLAAAIAAVLAFRPGSAMRNNPGLSGALVLLCMYFFGKVFLNYYWLVSALLIMGTVYAAGSESQKSHPAD